MNKMIVSNSPHTASSNSTRKIMLDVMIALVPALTAAILFFGLKALVIAIICVITSVLSEFIYNIIVERGFKIEKLNVNTALDGSAAVTGLLIALNLPVSVPLWLPPIGCVLAVVVVKMLFGGIGKNLANPALIARIFLFLSFTGMMVSTGTQNLLGLDAVSGATWLSNGRGAADIKYDWLNMLVGNKAAAAMGETSAVAILIGFAYLVIRRVIDFKWPLVIIGSTFVFALLFDGLKNASGVDIFVVSFGHIITGGLLLGAVFMATDYATSPNTNLGYLIYSVGIAFLVVVMRVFTSMPEGVSFAIVLMNFVVPILDKYVLPRPYAPSAQKPEAKTAPASETKPKAETTAEQIKPEAMAVPVSGAKPQETAIDEQAKPEAVSASNIAQTDETESPKESDALDKKIDDLTVEANKSSAQDEPEDAEKTEIKDNAGRN